MSVRPSLVAALVVVAVAACAPAHKNANPPPEHAAAEPPPPAPGLSPGDVATVVNEAHSKIQGCLFLASSPDNAGDIEIAWSVAPGGDVTQASVASATFPDQPVVDCVLKTMQKLHYPEAPGPTEATWKFKFGRH